MIEKALENVIFASRWLMAPFYLGLVVALAILLFKFLQSLIVIFSGYENFVSKLDVGAHEDRPEWMGKVDFGGLKMKLIASIVAISGIQLLKTFMNIEHVTEEDIFWQVVVHLTFVTSGVFLALMDWLNARGKASASH